MKYWMVRPLTQGLALTGPTAPIRYTLDGSNPSPESPLYRGPIPLSGAGVREIRYALQRADGSLNPLVFSRLLGGMPRAE